MRWNSNVVVLSYITSKDEVRFLFFFYVYWLSFESGPVIALGHLLIGLSSFLFSFFISVQILVFYFVVYSRC